MKKITLGLFASGSGTNVQNIIRFFKTEPSCRIAFVLCNNPKAKVIDRAKEEGIPVILCSNEEIEKPQNLIEICENEQVDYLILAGFLRKIPQDLIEVYRHKIINVHPSLLPKYGGKGMYGSFVHEAVLAAGEQESGISIHLVDEEFDRGAILAQFSCPISHDETLASLQNKIHQLEMKHFPETIHSFITNTNSYDF